MKIVAKLIMIDPGGKYLLMHRSDHPTFGMDPDLPGGTLEGAESPVEAMIREVYEESGVTVDASSIQEVYSGVDYSTHGTHYVLFVANLNTRPEIKMSWEHSSYVWLDKGEFLERARGAKDTYMHMVCDTIKS